MPRPGYYAWEDPGGKLKVIGNVSEDEAIAACIDMADRFRCAKVIAQLESDNRSAVRMRDEAYYRATARAKRFDRSLMSKAEFDALWIRSGGRCELTGITFSFRPEGSDQRIWPWGPSIDRIDNSRGYEFDNCRLVCVAMNMAMHEFGEEVFRVLATAYNARHAVQEPNKVRTP